MSKRKKKAIQQAKKAANNFQQELVKNLRFFGRPTGLYQAHQARIFCKFGITFALDPGCPAKIVWSNDLTDFRDRASKFNPESDVADAIQDLHSSDRDYMFAVCGDETLIYFAGSNQ